MRILITGGSGYVGSTLIPRLLKKNHQIINVDTQWFGHYLKNHSRLKNYKIDYAHIDKVKEKKIDVVIHLASISNDPMAEIDKNLSWETSALNTYRLMEFMKKRKIKKIIYASSGSVYGIKTEMTPPHPIKGNSYEEDLPKLASSCKAAINSFRHDQLMARIFSETLIENLCLTKQQELSVLADIKVTEHWRTFFTYWYVRAMNLRI